MTPAEWPYEEVDAISEVIHNIAVNLPTGVALWLPQLLRVEAGLTDAEAAINDVLVRVHNLIERLEGDE